jgi:hypothetical protein
MIKCEGVFQKLIFLKGIVANSLYNSNAKYSSYSQLILGYQNYLKAKTILTHGK